MDSDDMQRRAISVGWQLRVYLQESATLAQHRARDDSDTGDMATSRELTLLGRGASGVENLG